MSRTGGDHTLLMDKVYRRQRHIYDFTRKYYLLGRDRLVRELGVKPGERVVEIGCGTARNLICIARHYPGVQLFGLDASREMLLTAGDAVRLNGLESRIKLTHGIAEALTPATFGLDGPFDHAIFSYSLSMIPDWRAALRAAATAVKPQGLIHIVDFSDFGGLWPPAGKALLAWLKLFHVAPREELVAGIEKALGPSALRQLMGRYAFLMRAVPHKVVLITG